MTKPANHVTWTAREWQAVSALLPAKFPAKGPTPKMLDAAQRAALPPDRWRPMSSLYGRVNRARYTGEIMLALQRMVKSGNELATQLRDLHAAAAEVERQLDEIRQRNPLLRLTFEPINAGTPRVSVQSATPATEPAKERLNHVDIVGLIGHQITRTYEALRPEVRKVVRFVEADNNSRAMRDPALRAVIVPRFVPHDLIAAYDARGSRYVYVPRPTPARIAEQVEDLAYEDPNATAPLHRAKLAS